MTKIYSRFDENTKSGHAINDMLLQEDMHVIIISTIHLNGGEKRWHHNGLKMKR